MVKISKNITTPRIITFGLIIAIAGVCFWAWTTKRGFFEGIPVRDEGQALGGTGPNLTLKEPASQPSLVASTDAVSNRSAVEAQEWATALKDLRKQTTAALVHRAAVSRTPQDYFAAKIQLSRCLERGRSQAMVAHVAPQASEEMKRTVLALETLCRDRGDRPQLDYVTQSWPTDSPARRAVEARRRGDVGAMLDYVLSTGSADFAAEMLPGLVTLELLEARHLLPPPPPPTPEEADLTGLWSSSDMSSMQRLRDQHALSVIVAIRSCTQLGTCIEEALLNIDCHLPPARCVGDLRDYPEQQVFSRRPRDADGSPSLIWVSRARWGQIEQAVSQLLAGRR